MTDCQTLTPRRLSGILGRASGETLRRLAAPLMEKYPVTVIRRPKKTLVMIRMKETVAKADFYLGEMLASEALVELEGQKGFALIAGDDMDKVLHAAVLDAALKAALQERAGILSALLEEEQAIRRRTELEIQKHAPSRVQFNTLDVEY